MVVRRNGYDDRGDICSEMRVQKLWREAETGREGEGEGEMEEVWLKNVQKY